MNYTFPEHFLRFLDNPTTVALTGTTASNATALEPGLYYVTCDVDCFFRQGDSSVVATTSSNPLWANERVLIRVRGTGPGDGEADAYIAAILSSGTGTLYITPAKQ